MVSIYVIVYYLLLLFDKENSNNGRTRRKPKVTIAVPAYNEGKNILKALDSILGLKYPRDKLKIFVIDDGSKDDTRKEIRAFIRKHPELETDLIVNHKTQIKCIHHILGMDLRALKNDPQ